MKKTIILSAADIHNGISYQRLHMPLSRLRAVYDFKLFNFDDIRHGDVIYSDLIIMTHAFHESQATFAHRIKRQYNKKLILDFDDLLDHLPSDHKAYKDFKGCPIPELLMAAHHVVVSTEYLKLSWGHINTNMTVIENMSDPDRYTGMDPGVKPYHSGFIVGWTGSESHRPDLYNTGFLEGLIKAMEIYEEIRCYFHLLCPQILLDKFGSRVIFNEKPCDYLDYPSLSYTYPFDVCAVPLYDHPFNLAKSDLRLLDMSPFKIPIIASDLGPFKGHSERAILTANCSQSWFEAIERAYLDRSQLRDQAEKAYSYVRTDRHINKAVMQWDALLYQVLSS